MTLTFDQIMAADDLPKKTVLLPEWGGEVVVQGMTGKQRVAMGAVVRKKDGTPDVDGITRFALKNGIVEPVLTDEQVKEMMNKSGAVLDRIVDEFNILSGITEEAVLEARGNS